MLGCFNSSLGQIWTNSAIGFLTQQLTQIWVKTTQHFLECVFRIYKILVIKWP